MFLYQLLRNVNVDFGGTFFWCLPGICFTPARVHVSAVNFSKAKLRALEATAEDKCCVTLESARRFGLWVKKISTLREDIVQQKSDQEFHLLAFLFQESGMKDFGI